MGKFIAIYGVNNIGKSWHAKHIVERLNHLGKKAVYLKYPVYDIEPSGPFLNKTLRSGGQQTISEEELQVWYALNRFQFQPELRRLLEENDYVVAEDYAGTGICWGYTKGADLDWLENLNSKFIQPDLCILMRGERKVCSVEKNHLHESNEDLLTKAAETLEMLADRYRWERATRAEDYEVTKQRFWDILVADDPSLG
jgi:thymidylate kinase